jgi:hypothetical protein
VVSSAIAPRRAVGSLQITSTAYTGMQRPES